MKTFLQGNFSGVETAPWLFGVFGPSVPVTVLPFWKKTESIGAMAYRDEGFLDVKIEQSGVRISPEGRGLDPHQSY